MSSRGLKIYFAASISGGRQRQPIMQRIVDALKQDGHHVLSEHVANPNVRQLEKGISQQEIYSRDMAWIRECDLMVAEVSTPSLGVGYEICSALHWQKPVICLCDAEVFLTAMLNGNDSRFLRVLRYQKALEIEALLLKGLGWVKRELRQ